MTVCGLSYAQNFCSHHEHCVSKAEKTVFFLYSNLIGIHRLLIAVESGNQHNQRAFRQMKIGNQPIYTPERKTWIDENIRPPAACANFSIMIACNAFQCAAARLPIKNVEIRNVTVGEVTKFVKNVVNAENVVEENIIYKEKQDKQ